MGGLLILHLQASGRAWGTQTQAQNTQPQQQNTQTQQQQPQHSAQTAAASVREDARRPSAAGVGSANAGAPLSAFVGLCRSLYVRLQVSLQVSTY